MSVTAVADKLDLFPADYRDSLDVLSLRGRLTDLYGVSAILERLASGAYSLVILDALYRALPVGLAGLYQRRISRKMGDDAKQLSYCLP